MEPRVTALNSSVEVRPISSILTLILALACGITVANLYYVQPVAGLIAGDYGMTVASAGVFVTVTQLGYAAGLLLVVPLGDILENRRLIAGMLALLVAALVAVAWAPDAYSFLAASVLLGLASSVVQIIVPYAGHSAPDASRGRTVGNVVSGLLFGIMLARPASSFAAQFAGHRTIFAVSAVASAALSAFLWRALPERRPRGMPYFAAIGSLWPLLLQTKILQRRGAYQASLFGGFSLFWTAVPLVLSGPRFGFSQAGIGLFALAGAAGALASPYAGRLADQGYTRLVTLLSLAGAALAFLVAMAGGALASWPLLLAAALILDVAAASNLVTGQRAIFAVGEAARGRLNGLYLAVFFAGGSFGSFISGYALASGGWTAVCFAGLLFPLVALAYFATEKQPG
jgi:predicted MFS family arabinose efflux permease